MVYTSRNKYPNHHNVFRATCLPIADFPSFPVSILQQQYMVVGRLVGKFPNDTTAHRRYILRIPHFLLGRPSVANFREKHIIPGAEQQEGKPNLLQWLALLENVWVCINPLRT